MRCVRRIGRSKENSLIGMHCPRGPRLTLTVWRAASDATDAARKTYLKVRFHCCVCCFWRVASHAKRQTQTSRTMHSYETVLLGATNASDAAHQTRASNRRAIILEYWRSRLRLFEVWVHWVCVTLYQLHRKHYIKDGQTMTRWC